MCPANLPKFTEAGAGVGDLAVCNDLYVLKKFQGHDCFHIFPDSPNIKGIFSTHIIPEKLCPEYEI